MPDLEVVAGEAFVVPPLSRQQVPGQGLAQQAHAAHPQPPAAQAMMIRRWTGPAPAGSFGGRSPGLPSAYTRNYKLAIYYQNKC